MTDRLGMLQDELHARPHPVLSGPHVIEHRAHLCPEPAALAAVCAAAAERAGWRPTAMLPHLRTWIRGEVLLRLELHNEFVCLTCLHPQVDGVTPDPWHLLPDDLKACLGDDPIARVRIDLMPDTSRPLSRGDLEPRFGDHQFIAGAVSDGLGAVWSDLRRDPEQGVRFLVQDFGLSPRRCGRLIQRLLDIATYLPMTLLGLAEARRVQPRSVALNGEMEHITAEIADHGKPTDERRLLERLGTLVAEIEHLRNLTARRFNATPAYGDIVHERLAELRERKIAGFQVFTEFIERRLRPGLRTVASVRANLDDLAVRAQRTADLLRTRIDLTLAEQNRNLLVSMDRRAALQVRLQETVEGLSVVVLSYYIVGLVKYLAGMGEKTLQTPSGDIVAGFMVVPVLLFVWLAGRRFRSRLHRRLAD